MRTAIVREQASRHAPAERVNRDYSDAPLDNAKEIGDARLID
jgi:hypothetical protein